MDKEYVKLDSVQSLNEYLGMRTNHPLLDVINLSDVPEIEHRPKYFGVYGIVCGMAAADSASSGEASAEGGVLRGQRSPSSHPGSSDVIARVGVWDIEAGCLCFMRMYFAIRCSNAIYRCVAFLTRPTD